MIKVNYLAYDYQDFSDIRTRKGILGDNLYLNPQHITAVIRITGFNNQTHSRITTVDGLYYEVYQNPDTIIYLMTQIHPSEL